MMSNIERCDKDIFRSELSGIIIGVPAGMKNFISLESVDEVCHHLLLNESCTHSVHSAPENQEE